MLKMENLQILIVWYFAHGCASFSAAPEHEEVEEEEKEENLSEEDFEEVSHLDDDAEEVNWHFGILAYPPTLDK